MKLTKQLILFLLLFIQFSLHAQEFSYKHYTVQDGLVQTQVMNLFQDSKGYIWALTKGGVSRFDGINFLNFTVKDGLPANYNHGIAEDHLGNIWFISKEGLACFDGKKIIAYPTDLLRDVGGFLGLYESTPGQLTIVANSNQLQVVFFHFFEGNYKQTITLFPASEIKHPFFSPVGVYDTSQSIFWLASHKYGLFKIKGEDIEKVDINFNGFRSLWLAHNGELYLMFEDRICVLKNDELKIVLNNIDDSYNLINSKFAVDNNGLIYKLHKIKQSINLYHDGKVITDHFDFGQLTTFLIDRENNLWIASELGLFRLISPAFVNFIPEKSGINKMIWSIAEDKRGKIWFASHVDGFQYYDGSIIQKASGYEHLTNYQDFRYYMGSIIDHDQNILFATTLTVGIKYDGSVFSPFPFKIESATTLIFFEDPDNFDLYAGTNNGLFRIPKNKPLQKFDLHPGNGKSQNVVSIIKDKYKRFWMGGFSGISLLEGDQITHLPNAEMPFEEGGNTMIVDSSKNIWIGNGNGLFHYNYEGFKEIEHPNLNTMITSLALIDDSALLIGHVNGLAMLDLNAFYKDGRIALTTFGKDDGFQGIEVAQNAIFRDSKGLFWIPTSDRVIRFDPNLYTKNKLPPSISISNISLLTKKMDWVKVNNDRLTASGYQFTNKEQNLRFEFTGISTTAPERVKFSYFLKGNDAGWSEPTHDHTAVYTNLNPGDYTLYLKACNGNDVWTHEPVTLSFRIVPALYQRLWFWIISISLAVVLLLYLGSILSNRKKQKLQKQLETEKKMAQLQLLTLQNQLDPHFTFNALNAIASVVLKEDKKSAYGYFVKLSKLIRGIMSTSDSLVRTLEDEVEFVTDFLDINQLRYNNLFDFSITIAPQIDISDLVPNMCIQTFTENAIKHGLIHKQGKGMLRVAVFKKNEALHIVVEDNGIGRAQAKKSSVSSTGKGLMIINGYFDYFNRFNVRKITCEIIDLYSEQGLSCGTKVVVQIPDNYSFVE